MSEFVNRLIARSRSDIERGVSFAKGMEHFTELIHTALVEIEVKFKLMQELAERLDKKQ